MDTKKLKTLGPFGTCLDVIVNHATKYRKDIEIEGIIHLYRGFKMN